MMDLLIALGMGLFVFASIVGCGAALLWESK